jgi:hypothetical protein
MTNHNNTSSDNKQRAKAEGISGHGNVKWEWGC